METLGSLDLWTELHKVVVSDEFQAVWLCSPCIAAASYSQHS